MQINVILDPQEAVVSKWFFDLKGNRTGIAEWTTELDGCEHADADYDHPNHDGEIFCPECNQTWSIEDGFHVMYAGGVGWDDEEDRDAE